MNLNATSRRATRWAESRSCTGMSPLGLEVSDATRRQLAAEGIMPYSHGVARIACEHSADLLRRERAKLVSRHGAHQQAAQRINAQQPTGQHESSNFRASWTETSQVELKQTLVSMSFKVWVVMIRSLIQS